MPVIDKKKDIHWSAGCCKEELIIKRVKKTGVENNNTTNTILASLLFCMF